MRFNFSLLFLFAFAAALTSGSLVGFSPIIDVNSLPLEADLAISCDGEERGITDPPRFGRLMHDPQWMEWPSRMSAPDWPKGFHFEWYPETVQLWTGPRSGDGAVPYTIEWLEYLRDLQPDNSAAIWITRIAAGLFNSSRENESIPILDLTQIKTIPVAESISTGGNVVLFQEFKNGSGRLEMLNVKQQPPSTNRVDYETKPWLVTKFTSVSLDGEVGLANGQSVFFPNLARDNNGYWVDLKRVELFPALPFCATIKERLNMHSSPAIFASITGSVTSGQHITIREYLPQGSDVWGKTDGGWILLEYQNDGRPIYPTSWEMETRPPMVFD